MKQTNNVVKFNAALKLPSVDSRYKAKIKGSLSLLLENFYLKCTYFKRVERLSNLFSYIPYCKITRTIYTFSHKKSSFTAFSVMCRKPLSSRIEHLIQYPLLWEKGKL